MNENKVLYTWSVNMAGDTGDTISYSRVADPNVSYYRVTMVGNSRSVVSASIPLYSQVPVQVSASGSYTLGGITVGRYNSLVICVRALDNCVFTAHDDNPASAEMVVPCSVVFEAIGY